MALTKAEKQKAYRIRKKARDLANIRKAPPKARFCQGSDIPNRIRTGYVWGRWYKDAVTGERYQGETLDEALIRVGGVASYNADGLLFAKAGKPVEYITDIPTAKKAWAILNGYTTKSKAIADCDKDFRCGLDLAEYKE